MPHARGIVGCDCEESLRATSLSYCSCRSNDTGSRSILLWAEAEEPEVRRASHLVNAIKALLSRVLPGDMLPFRPEFYLSPRRRRAYFSVPEGPTPHRNHHVQHRLLHWRSLACVSFAVRWRHYPGDVSVMSLRPWCCYVCVGGPPGTRC
jgi:hypothetical protein